MTTSIMPLSIMPLNIMLSGIITLSVLTLRMMSQTNKHTQYFLCIHLIKLANLLIVSKAASVINAKDD